MSAVTCSLLVLAGAGLSPAAGDDAATPEVPVPSTSPTLSPVKPSNPVSPAPSGPAKPSKPSKPGKPSKPSKPGKPSKPSKPVKDPKGPKADKADKAEKDSKKKDEKSEVTLPAPAPEVPQAASVAEGPSGFSVWGVDVSKWQHEDAALGWPQIAGSAKGFRFAFVKGSEGTVEDVNPWFTQDVQAARTAGARVGVYHYAGPEKPVATDAVAEARWAVAQAGKPAAGDLPLVLDFEANPNALTAQELSQWALTWLGEVERLTGRTPIFYTYPSFFTAEVFADPEFAQYPLWIAHYGSAVTEPTVPDPWLTWSFWQFSSKGELPGTFGFIDLNVFAGSAKELDLLAGVERKVAGLDVEGLSVAGGAMLEALTTPTQ